MVPWAPTSHVGPIGVLNLGLGLGLGRSVLTRFSCPSRSYDLFGVYTYPPGWITGMNYVRFRAMGKQNSLETKLNREPPVCLHKIAEQLKMVGLAWAKRCVPFKHVVVYFPTTPLPTIQR